MVRVPGVVVSSRRWLIGSCVTIWLVLTATGMSMLMASTYTPSPAADTRPLWPAGLALCPATDRPTLVLAFHPRCPCSDATLDALETLLDRTANKPAVFALLAIPANASADWTDNELSRRLRTMRGVSTLTDTDGLTSLALGAKTSGQTFAYDTAGRLVFAGGITPGRGEAGDCEGAAFLAGWLAKKRMPAGVFNSHVFGCALYRAKGVAE